MPIEQVDAISEVVGGLSLEHAGSILFYSFRFSQGKPEIQGDIFYYVHMKYPDYQIPKDSRQELFDRLEARSQAFVLGSLYEGMRIAYHDNIPPKTAAFSPNELREDRIKEIGRTLYGQIDTMTARLNRIHTLDDKLVDDLVKKLAIGIIQRDFKYLRDTTFTGLGRPRTRTSKDKLAGDPWSSHIIDYALKGHPTKVPEFDEMFEDINQYLLSDHSADPKWLTTQPLLDHVISVYNLHHPNGQVENLNFRE